VSPTKATEAVPSKLGNRSAAEFGPSALGAYRQAAQTGLPRLLLTRITISAMMIVDLRMPMLALVLDAPRQSLVVRMVPCRRFCRSFLRSACAACAAPTCTRRVGKAKAATDSGPRDRHRGPAGSSASRLSIGSRVGIPGCVDGRDLQLDRLRRRSAEDQVVEAGPTQSGSRPAPW
jgi:hypothetical protein